MRKYGVSKKQAAAWGERMLAEYKLTEEYKKEKAEMDEELKNFILYGERTTWFDNDLLEEIVNYDGAVKIEELSLEQIIERFGHMLTEKDLERLKNEME